MVRLAESLELWCTGRKFAGVISWTRPVLRVRFSKDSVKIVIESYYLFSNVNFYNEIFSWFEKAEILLFVSCRR